ncbi:MAG: AI-2E family transporter [Vallitaleaceae bacterium]|nr:AI-2E family transporter [Vallitaleaceae bacterium]
MLTKEELKKMLLIGLMIGGLIALYHIFDNLNVSIAFMKNSWKVVSPIFVGFVIAFIVNIPMMGIEKLIFKKSRRKKSWHRLVSLLLTLFFIVIFAILIFAFTIPQLIDSINQLIENIDNYVADVGVFFNDTLIRLNLSQEVLDEALKIWKKLLDGTSKLMLNLANSTLTLFAGFISGIFNMIISLVLAIYMLLSKERLQLTFRKLFYAFYPVKGQRITQKYLGIVNASFVQFIRGQLLEAVVLGILCYIGMLIIGFEYPLLISVLIGITNVIPMFGPYIGGTPSFFLLLMVEPSSAFWFLLYLIVLQQIEGNLIYPRVVGTSLGISGFWILTALVIGNNLFGIMGILIGIPLFSSVYIIVKEITEEKLRKLKIRLH